MTHKNLGLLETVLSHYKICIKGALLIILKGKMVRKYKLKVYGIQFKKLGLATFGIYWQPQKIDVYFQGDITIGTLQY